MDDEYDGANLDHSCGQRDRVFPFCFRLRTQTLTSRCTMTVSLQFVDSGYEIAASSLNGCANVWMLTKVHHGVSFPLHFAFFVGMLRTRILSSPSPTPWRRSVGVQWLGCALLCGEGCVRQEVGCSVCRMTSDMLLPLGGPIRFCGCGMSVKDRGTFARHEVEIEGLHELKEFGSFDECDVFSAEMKGGVVAKVTALPA